MHLIGLGISNFRVYYGEQKIKFSTEKGKNVTLVHAENGIGKTTMLNAIKWCLYGKTPDFSDKKKLVHHLYVEKGGYSCWVELDFEHNGEKYNAKRSYNQNTGEQTLTLLEIKEFGTTKKIQEGAAVINSILPEELSDYFLFSGEHFKKIFESSSGATGYRKAVRDILGFTLSDIANNDLLDLYKKNRSKKNALLKDQKNTNLLALELDKAYIREENLKGDIKNIKEDIKGFEEIKKDCDKKIQDSHHFEAEELSKQRNEKVAFISREEGRKRILLTERQGLIKDFGYAIFGSSALSGQNLEFIKKEEYEGKIPAPYDESFVNKLIREKKCICTRPLVEGTPEFDSVQSLRQSANTALIHQRVQKALSVGDHFKGRSKEFLERLRKVEGLLESLDITIESLKKSKEQLTEKLKNINNQDITDLVSKQTNAEQQIRHKLREQGQKEVLLDSIKSRIANLQRETRQFQVDNPELKLRNSFEEVYQQLMSRIKTKQTQLEKSAKGIITAKVQANVDDCLRTNYEVLIDENYSIRLRYEGTDVKLEGSDGGNGQTLLVNLSYITALIKHSEDRVDSKSKYFQAGTIAPFVVDAPFSEMDGEFKKSVLGFLPNQSHQLILFLSTGQWNDAYEEIIGRSIGKRYYLVSHNNPKSNVKTEPLVIGNDIYETTILDNPSPFPYSKIETINLGEE